MAQATEKGYSLLLDEHSVEGLEILQSSSKIIAHALIYIILLMLFATIIWSFMTYSDVIILTKGQLRVRGDSRRIYAPANGDLAEIFVTEGVPVEKGDLLVRIRSTQAIQIASAAAQAKFGLEEASLMQKQFPEQKKIMEREIASISQSIRLMTADYERQKKEGVRQLSDTQKRQLETLQSQLLEKDLVVNQARDTLGKYNRLFNSAGRGGVSEKEMLEKTNELQRAEAAYRQTISQLEDLELSFSQQDLANYQKIEQLNMQIIGTTLQLDQKKSMISKTENQVRLKYLAAQEAWEAASRVNFSDLDENNFLVIRAPVSGEVSVVWVKQHGEKVTPGSPLLSISPADATKSVNLSILDKDRGLLRVGQLVKLKFHAFPYQRFGFLTGRLDYLSNNAVVTTDGQSRYKGKVVLNKTFYIVNGRKIPLRLGMNADVEIVVQRRRVIDFVLDPFRKNAVN